METEERSRPMVPIFVAGCNVFQSRRMNDIITPFDKRGSRLDVSEDIPLVLVSHEADPAGTARRDTLLPEVIAQAGVKYTFVDGLGEF